MIKQVVAILVSLSIMMADVNPTSPLSSPTGVSKQVNTDFTAMKNSGALQGSVSKSYSSSSSIPFENNTVLKPPLFNLLNAIQWPLFLKEFEISLKLGTCCPKGDPLSCAIGLKAHMIEPIGFFEVTKEPFYFPFIDLRLGGGAKHLIKSGVLDQRNSGTEKGGSTPRSVSGYSHFIFLPIFGLIFKKKLKFVCFHDGDLLIPYLSEFDPSWRIDAYYSKMVPHMIFMFTPSSLIGGIFDCVSTEIVNAIRGYSSQQIASNPQKTLQAISAQEKNYAVDVTGDDTFKVKSMNLLNGIRDTMYYVDGCNGFSPVGGYVNGDDPIAEATLTFHGVMGVLHGASMLSPVPFLQKQVNMSFFHNMIGPAVKHIPTGFPDTMCRPKKFALPIASQYALQLSYPVVGKAKELGVIPARVSTAHNVPGSKNASVYTVWERRDYYAFAYQCPSSDTN